MSLGWLLYLQGYSSANGTQVNLTDGNGAAVRVTASSNLSLGALPLRGIMLAAELIVQL